eukprot:4231391-Pyramimonas_sp.AAC.1
MAGASAGLPPRPTSLPPALHPLPRAALRRPAPRAGGGRRAWPFSPRPRHPAPSIHQQGATPRAS